MSIRLITCNLLIITGKEWNLVTTVVDCNFLKKKCQIFRKMEETISNVVKVLSHTILVHIYSYPHFSIELFLSCVVCIVHCLLIIEVNRLYQRTNAKAAARLRMRHTPFKGESYLDIYLFLFLLESIWGWCFQNTFTYQCITLLDPLKFREMIRYSTFFKIR